MPKALTGKHISFLVAFASSFFRVLLLFQIIGRLLHALDFISTFHTGLSTDR
jgi:hypothetical protein